MKIFAIGLSGYIGSVVTEKRQALGHELTGLARSDASAQLLKSRNVRPVAGELGNAEAIGAAAHEADGVIVLATGGFLTGALAPGVSSNYVNTTAAILDALEGTHKPFGRNQSPHRQAVSMTASQRKAARCRHRAAVKLP